jgi:hypothetical protein
MTVYPGHAQSWLAVHPRVKDGSTPESSLGLPLRAWTGRQIELMPSAETP